MNKIYKILNIVLTLSLCVTMIYIIKNLNTLDKNVNELRYNQELILMQTQINENSVTKINTELSEIDKLINKYSLKYKVDPTLVHAVAITESGKNQTSVSPAKAIGVMQVTKSTAKAMGVTNPYNTEQNIIAGVKYLAYLDKKFNGNKDLVIAGYNAGETAVIKHKGVPPYKETRNYVKKVKKEQAKLQK